MTILIFLYKQTFAENTRVPASHSCACHQSEKPQTAGTKTGFYGNQFCRYGWREEFQFEGKIVIFELEVSSLTKLVLACWSMFSDPDRFSLANFDLSLDWLTGAESRRNQCLFIGWVKRHVEVLVQAQISQPFTLGWGFHVCSGYYEV